MVGLSYRVEFKFKLAKYIGPPPIAHATCGGPYSEENVMRQAIQSYKWLLIFLLLGCFCYRFIGWPLIILLLQSQQWSLSLSLSILYDYLSVHSLSLHASSTILCEWVYQRIHGM